MISGLEGYKLLFVLQLMVGEEIFLYRLERKRDFWKRTVLFNVLMLIIAWFYPAGYTAVYQSIMFFFFFLCTLLVKKLCYDEPFENILFCGIAGYTIQHLSFLLYTIFMDATRIGDIFGNVLQPYSDQPIQSSDMAALQIVFYLDIYFLVYNGAFDLFDKRLEKNHNLHLGRTSIVCLSGLLIATDVIFNMITTYYTQGNLISLLLERSYNVLMCILILALLYTQLSQRDLKDELSGIQYIMEQSKKQYEMAKKSADLINIKYHDLRHQSEQLQRLGFSSGMTQEAHEELNQVLDSYALLVQTGSEVLDVILTEKTMLCRDQSIQLLCMVDGKQLEFVKPHHLYTLLGNALDNAIEAVQSLPEEERIINLYVQRQGSLVVIHVENPCTTSVNIRAGLPVTSKTDHNYHGYGMLSMKTVAEQYGGGLSVSVEDNLFSLDVVLSQENGDG
jgi:hypothetical protein